LRKRKVDDFIILENDIMKEAPEKILGIKVIKTFLGGEKVYEMKN